MSSSPFSLFIQLVLKLFQNQDQNFDELKYAHLKCVLCPCVYYQELHSVYKLIFCFIRSYGTIFTVANIMTIAFDYKSMKICLRKKRKKKRHKSRTSSQGANATVVPLLCTYSLIRFSLFFQVGQILSGNKGNSDIIVLLTHVWHFLIFCRSRLRAVWQAIVAYVNIACYYLFGNKVNLGVFLHLYFLTACRLSNAIH